MYELLPCFYLRQNYTIQPYLGQRLSYIGYDDPLICQCTMKRAQNADAAAFGPVLPRPWVCAVGSRLLLFAFGTAMVALGEPYDTSLSILTTTASASKQGSADAWITRFLAPFANWDGVYFLSIAKASGYEFEKFHAFFPLLPLACSLLRRAALWPLEALGITSPSTSLLVAGLLLNLAAFAIAAEILFALGRCIFGSEVAPHSGAEAGRTSNWLFLRKRSSQSSVYSDLPLLAAYLFCITPAGVFVSVLYTERCALLAGSSQPSSILND